MKFKKKYGQYTFSLESVKPNPAFGDGREIYVELKWLGPVAGGIRSGSTETSFIGVEKRLYEFVGKLAVDVENGELPNHPDVVSHAITFLNEAIRIKDYKNYFVN